MRDLLLQPTNVFAMIVFVATLSLLVAVVACQALWKNLGPKATMAVILGVLLFLWVFATVSAIQSKW